jgi:hypothetical protein
MRAAPEEGAVLFVDPLERTHCDATMRIVALIHDAGTPLKAAED